jgi:hypothetical protein
MSSKQGFKVGVLISGILALMIISGILIAGVRSYDGYCVSFEPPKRPCGILEFLLPYLLLWIVFSVIGRPILAIGFFIIVVAPPMLGYMICRRKSKSTSG